MTPWSARLHFPFVQLRLEGKGPLRHDPFTLAQPLQDWNPPLHWGADCHFAWFESVRSCLDKDEVSAFILLHGTGGETQNAFLRRRLDRDRREHFRLQPAIGVGHL